MSVLIYYGTRKNRSSSICITMEDGGKYKITTHMSDSKSSCSYDTLDEVHNHLSIFTHVIAVDRGYVPQLEVITNVIPMVRLHARLNRKLLHNIVTVVMNQAAKQKQASLSEGSHPRLRCTTPEME